jgi:hypothetical protein
MSWSTVFRLRQFARGSLWLLPLAGGLLGVLLGSGLVLADQRVHMPSYWTYSASTASTVLSAIVGAMAAYSFALLQRIENNRVPDLGVSIAGLLVLSTLLLFVFFLDRFIHRLRPVAVVLLVAGYVHRGFERYTAALATAPDVFSGAFEPAGE